MMTFYTIVSTILLIFFYFSASGSGQGSIDHRIEQAMVSTMMIIYVCVAEIIM